MCLNNENHVISIQEVEQAMYKTALACCKTEVQWVVCVGFTCSHLLNTAIYSQVVYNTTSILVETEPDGEAAFSLRYYPLFLQSLERALKFSYQEYHVWIQFALSLMETGQVGCLSL